MVGPIAVAIAVGSGLTVTGVTTEVDEQPLLLVTTTVYEPGAVTM